MVVYVIIVVHLIRELQAVHPQVTQTWYYDNTGSGGSSPQLQRHLEDIMVQVQARGYFLDPTKIILAVSKRNVLRAQVLF